MKKLFKSRKLALGLSTAIFLALIMSSSLVLSHDDDDDDDDDAQATTPTDSNSTTTIAANDSLYALINENYQSVRHIFEYSCFDCHSTFTNYPWYYEIPGIKGLIDDDIKEGMGHFDLSNDFPFKSKHDQADILKDIKEEIEEDGMPLISYRMIHWGRLIEGARRDSVFQWIDASLALLPQTEDADE